MIATAMTPSVIEGRITTELTRGARELSKLGLSEHPRAKRRAMSQSDAFDYGVACALRLAAEVVNSVLTEASQPPWMDETA